MFLATYVFWVASYRLIHLCVTMPNLEKSEKSGYGLAIQELVESDSQNAADLALFQTWCNKVILYNNVN